MPCPFMHIRSFACVIGRFSLVLILNNKFLHTVFRHSHSPLCLYQQSLFISPYTYKITFPIQYFVIHIRPFACINSRFSLVLILIK